MAPAGEKLLRRVVLGGAESLGDGVERLAGELGTAFRPSDDDLARQGDAARVEHRRGRDIGIDVEAERLRLPRLVDHLQCFADQPVIGRAARLVVRDDDGNARCPSDLDRLTHRRDQMRGFVAHVRGVDAAIGLHRLRQRDHLVGRRILGRRIIKPGRHADGAALQRCLQSAPHGVDLGRRRGAVERIHRAGAQGCVPDLAGGVQRRRVLVERREIAVKGLEELARFAADDVERRRRIAVRATAARG